jgi:hypothetical protein
MKGSAEPQDVQQEHTDRHGDDGDRDGQGLQGFFHGA